MRKYIIYNAPDGEMLLSVVRLFHEFGRHPVVAFLIGVEGEP